MREFWVQTESVTIDEIETHAARTTSRGVFVYLPISAGNPAKGREHKGLKTPDTERSKEWHRDR